MAQMHYLDHAQTASIPLPVGLLQLGKPTVMNDYSTRSSPPMAAARTCSVQRLPRGRSSDTAFAQSRPSGPCEVRTLNLLPVLRLRPQSHASSRPETATRAARDIHDRDGGIPCSRHTREHSAINSACRQRRPLHLQHPSGHTKISLWDGGRAPHRVGLAALQHRRAEGAIDHHLRPCFFRASRN